MKDLLEAIKAELVSYFADLSYTIDVEIILDGGLEEAIDAGASFPFIGIKDGGTDREEGFGETLGEEMPVEITVYVQIDRLHPRRAIVGAGETKGVLDLIDDLHTALNEDFLSLTGIDRAFAGEEEESSTLLTEDGYFVQQKKALYIYSKVT